MTRDKARLPVQPNHLPSEEGEQGVLNPQQPWTHHHRLYPNSSKHLLNALHIFIYLHPPQARHEAGAIIISTLQTKKMGHREDNLAMVT